MDFVTIDFETADSLRDTPCEIGLTFVEGGKVTETKSWLIKPNCWPHFDDFNIDIHGITPNMVKNAPEFPDVWSEILPRIKGAHLIAHNAGFDFSVLRHTLSAYDLTYPDVDYSCSYIFSRHGWPGLASYGLAYLCNHHGIALEHHRAGPDSLATAELSLRTFLHHELTDFSQLTEKLRTTPGRLFAGGYNPCTTTRTYTNEKRDLSKFVPQPGLENPDSIFYRQKVVFTGTLKSMPRAQAFQMLVDIGGDISELLTTDVNYLVVGQQNYKVVGASGLSGKQKKAAAYAAKGFPIEIVSEEFFLNNI